MVCQKAKVKWMTEGDDNTKFFHAVMKNRERRNTFHGLEINGEWVDDPERVKNHVFDFFKSKFSCNSEVRPTFNSSKTRRISTEDAMSLESPFEEEEVWLAIKECGNNKSPGPDGFSFGVEFMEALRWFWEKESTGPGCNSSFLSLLPKVSNPIVLSDYRPISLIGVFYKVVTKVLAQRIKKVIGKIISEPQCAFIKGRNILDGCLIANEVADFVKNKKKWIGWISACLKSSSMSVLINGAPTKEFSMERGLRQGDPLAPFLFLIVAENLHLLMEEAKDKGLFDGILVGNDRLEISHLQFADDAIFFGKWSARNLRNLIKVLDCFRAISGLRINMHKSKIFGVGVSNEEVQEWARGVGCVGGSFPFTYLGLPVGDSMLKKSDWRPVVDKVKAKLASWKAKIISYGGRLTLVKSGGVKKKAHAWVSWQKCVKPLLKGGLNIGCIKNMNRALLAKWWWRFRVGGVSLWGRVIKNIYGKDGGFGVGEGAYRGGWGSVWKGIIGVGACLDELGINFSGSFRKVVGDGGETRFWKDCWMGDRPLARDFPRLSRLASNVNLTISEQGEWVGDSWSWNWSWRSELRGRTLGEFEDLQRRLVGWEPVRGKGDSWGWEFDLEKGFSVHRLRQVLADLDGLDEEDGGKLWASFLPKKVNVFRWRLKLGRIPTRVALDKLGIDLDSVLCSRCGEEIENLDHAFVSCREVKNLWYRVRNWWNKPSEDFQSVAQMLQEDADSLKSQKSKAWWVGVKWIFLCLLWSQRNRLVFENKKSNLLDLFYEWQRIAFEWISKRVKDVQFDWFSWLSGVV
ncbi:hypothetical protein OSB04_015790 [Centaurea solstitialis]|uniref:Reverse transcriptase domain-containing protein n=1 Tax=Centaurea solstitialis TaxID=347529 RepID=A0AA38SZP9_9ASTR|nr:hypothetical protein OSB04_015790 [Centaurea solstitialis]